ncbi:hypothetical protein IQ260_25535 [Leptolyngbya cf. ectocarpi LEGE 11479]|uniref:DUF3040 domain-containing protein n=1 Tax=Leptolyngbya cf. ectocarpi LEGE 11479 TaxID=1828722 RepID=A0A928ZZ27_LEPEC|nr:hypothetical protein [Leptolyngbya ectocarpi]MBE9070008.1 hypothetical protein [Leptolyngbya cf. ectocarpi LEGE 11479]
MNPERQSKEEELQRWEAALKEREVKVRMRELESEIEQSNPAQPTARHKKHKAGPNRSWFGRLPKVVQFGLLVVGVMIGIRVASWFAGVLILFAIGWVGYKLFIERDRNPR